MDVGGGTEISSQCGEVTFGSTGWKNKLHTPRKQRNKVNDKRTVRHEKIKIFLLPSLKYKERAELRQV